MPKPMISREEYDRWIESEYPELPWRTPLLVRSPVHTMIACRLCAARLGLKTVAGEIQGQVFTDMTGFNAHMAEAHKARAN